jgi:hypothetical protein
MHQRRHRPCLQRRAEVIWWAADRLRALGGLDGSYAIAIDAVGSAYLTGATSPSNFPVRPGAFQTTYGGGPTDAFVTKITNVVLPPGPTVGKVTGGGTVDVSGGIANFGFIVQRQASDGSIHGDLQYVNHASRRKGA